MENRNLASKYAKKVDERFSRESQAMLALNNDYSFTGVRTVNVYSIPTVPMVDYNRSGGMRYGEPNELTRTVQTMTLSRDRAFTFIIDKGDKAQSQMVTDAGKALARQLKDVWVPEFDAYVFRKLAAEAVARDNVCYDPIDKENAYESFLNAMEVLGNCNVPDKGRVAFCSYRFANLLKMDPAFMKQGDASQEMVQKGVIGEVDGCKIVKVPSSRLPAGCAFILTHPMAATAPKQLEEYKTHADPPGISGWLVEGRVIYDCFILENKADAIYYHGDQPGFRLLDVTVARVSDTEIQVMTNPGEPEFEGGAYYYQLCDVPVTVVSGQKVTSDGWTLLSKSGAWVEVGTEPAAIVSVVESDASGTIVAIGFTKVV